MPADIKAFRFTANGESQGWMSGKTAERAKGAADQHRQFGGSVPKIAVGNAANPNLDGCIVLVDEAHLLFDPERMKALFSGGPAKAISLQKQLTNARGSVVVLFTGTPAARGVNGVNELLKVVKGKEGVNNGNEGYISYFLDPPARLFAEKLQDTAVSLPNIITVNMHPEFEKKYLAQRFFNAAAQPASSVKGWLSVDELKAKLPLAGNAIPSRCVTTWDETSRQWQVIPPAAVRPRSCQGSRTASRESISYHWSGPTGEPVLDADPPNWKSLKLRGGAGVAMTILNGMEFATKTFAIAKDIADDVVRMGRRRRTLVMMHKETGLRTLRYFLKQFNINAIVCEVPKGSTVKEVKDHQTRMQDKIAEFNLNMNSHVLVLNELQNEGISVLDVERMILADMSKELVPPNISHLNQRIGRALRMCGHERTRASMGGNRPTLDIDLFVVRHSHNDTFPPTIDEEKLQLLTQLYSNNDEAIIANRTLSDMSVDGILYT
jgi:hypothetical protein